jgi:hypothetical protein
MIGRFEDMVACVRQLCKTSQKGGPFLHAPKVVRMYFGFTNSSAAGHPLPYTARLTILRFTPDWWAAVKDPRIVSRA